MGTPDFWTIVTIVLAAVAILVSIVIYMRQRRVKRLDYAILGRFSLLTQAARGQKKLEVLFDGTAVRNPWVTVVRIKNTGTEPVASGDYVQSIAIKFDDEVRILAADVEAHSDSIAAPAREAGSVVLYKPLLLNRGEWFEVRVVTDGHPATLSISSHFAGADRPMENVSTFSGRDLSRWWLLCCTPIAVGFGYFFYLAANSAVVGAVVGTLMGLFMGGMAWIVIRSVVGVRRMRRVLMSEEMNGRA